MSKGDGWDKYRMLLMIEGGIGMKEKGAVKLGFLIFLLILVLLLIASLTGLE